MEGDKRDLDMFKDNEMPASIPEIVAKIPLTVKKRICAIKKIQLNSIELEAKFYERVHQLEKEFEPEFNKLYEQRRKIVAGEYEPNDEESNLPIIHGLRDEAIKCLNDKSDPDDGSKGVPSFWLHVLKGSDMTQDMIQEHDEPILKHLTDITTTIEVDPHGFTIYFHFSPNEFFTNSVLKKQYFLEIKPDPEDPFSFDGPSVVRAVGLVLAIFTCFLFGSVCLFSDTINWKEGKNITRKVVKKKLKKGSNAGKFITKTVKADSFFNFFDTIVPPLDDHRNEDDEEDDSHEIMRADFEVGQAELGDDMYDVGEDDDDEDEEESSDEDDE
ncbi:hypothetical protein Angca_007698 [Angiostrongylus cantonensis]|nr:hypothetical protein Angca_007698 [Angiostrongylus cantonensis]